MSARGRQRVDVLGVGVSVVTMEDVLGDLERWIELGERRYVCVTNVHAVMECQRDPELMRIHNSSGLTVADGAPIYWAGRLAAGRAIGRVRGPDLLPRACELAAERGWRVYFYGGAEGTPERLAGRMATRYRGLRVAGAYAPPFRPLSAAEDEAEIDRINAARPDIVWVGLSAPKQERWMGAHVGRVEAPVMIGVGAAFDIYAGNRQQAPRWMRPLGLEWLYRLWREPRRLWRRYLETNPRFVAKIIVRPPRLR